MVIFGLVFLLHFLKLSVGNGFYTLFYKQRQAESGKNQARKQHSEAEVSTFCYLKIIRFLHLLNHLRYITKNVKKNKYVCLNEVI